MAVVVNPGLDRSDLEKAYDRVPREELWYCMRKSGVAEKYVRVVQDMYERSRTVVRCAVGQTEEFKVEVGLHQGSALSPFLFAIVMDQLSEEVRQESPWTMMFADDIVICSESREQVEENLERWRFALERRGMKVSRSKTEYMCVNEREGNGTVRLQGEEVKKVQEFKYLGSTVQSNGECGKEVKKRVQAGWNGWRKVSGVLCDRKISARIKGKVYRTVVRPAMLYGLETVSLRKRQESELENTSPDQGPADLQAILIQQATMISAFQNKVEVLQSENLQLQQHAAMAAGFFFVEKIDGGLWPCIDYRGLSALTVRYPYPLPLEGDEWKTAFHTTSEHFEYLVMPYGLTNAPAIFQSLINKVFRDILNKYVIAYIDDILIYSSSLKEHIQHVRTLLNRLLSNHLYIKAEKCEFHRPSISFLGCQLPEGLLEPLHILCRPWSHLVIDFLSDLPNSQGFTTVMVVIDRFSKACKLIPLKGLSTAMDTATTIFQHVFQNFGLPEDIVSDRGIQFTSRVWRAFCAQLGISISLSSGYHPQSNGQAVRLNQEIWRFLRTYCSTEQHRWSEILPWADYAQNSLTHSSTGLTPIQCILGYQPPLFPWTGEPSDVPSVNEWSCKSQELPASYRICPTFHVSLLKPAHDPCPDTGSISMPPPPLDIDGAPAYQ
ncbi:hypothetical protein QTP86_029277, partial [Hemibagrus guttatus]